MLATERKHLLPNTGMREWMPLPEPTTNDFVLQLLRCSLRRRAIDPQVMADEFLNLIDLRSTRRA